MYLHTPASTRPSIGMFMLSFTTLMLNPHYTYYQGPALLENFGGDKPCVIGMEFKKVRARRRRAKIFCIFALFWGLSALESKKMKLKWRRRRQNFLKILKN